MEVKEKNLRIRHNRKIVWLIAISVFLIECAIGYYYNVYVGYYHSDGISRVANAFYVLYSRNPHLGAIGFVWNPLPSMIDMVFLLLYPWIPAMATKGIAGLLMSAIFASLTAGILVKAFIQRGIPCWCAVVFTLLYSLNPMFLIFGFNGLSDGPFIFFVILSILSFLNWLDDHKLGDFIVMSFALTLAFWCRYEAVPFAFSMVIGCIITVMLIHKNAVPPNEGVIRYKWSRAEGMLAIIITPIFYSIILWVLPNAIIMNNPLYFLSGDYSNIAQLQGHLNSPIFASMLNSPVMACIYALKKILVFSLPLIAILILKLLNHRFWRWDTLILLGMFISIPMLQIIMLVKGTTLGWLRYFMYVLPVSLAWLPYELSKVKYKWQFIILIAAMIANFGILSYVITQPNIAPDENIFFRNTFGHRTQDYYNERQFSEIAVYLDENYPNSTILADSSSAYSIILESRFPKRFYITSDYKFANATSDPEKYGVSYILIPKPGSSTQISAINIAHPNLFDNGADWVKLVKDFGSNWRIYKVTKSTGAIIK